MKITPRQWLAATLLTLMLSSAHLLDGPTDLQTAQAIADDLQAAQAQATAQQSATNTVAARAVSTGANGQKAVILASVVQP